MKYPLLIIITLFIFNCKSQPDHICDNFEYLLNIDSNFVVRFDDSMTIKMLTDSVIYKMCTGNKRHTGHFQLFYNFKQKEFVTTPKKACRIQFCGYRCPNSLLDFFYNSLEFEITSQKEIIYNNSLTPYNTINELVYEHIGINLSIGDPYMIIIMFKSNIKVQNISKLVWEILYGYKKFVSEYSKVKYIQSFCNLTNKQIFELKKSCPLNISLKLAPDERSKQH